MVIVLLSMLVIGTPWLSVAQQPIRIGVSLSLTGRYTSFGSYAREAYLLCQKHVNEKGGVLGRSIEFVIYDDWKDRCRSLLPFVTG